MCSVSCQQLRQLAIRVESCAEPGWHAVLWDTYDKTYVDKCCVLWAATASAVCTYFVAGQHLPDQGLTAGGEQHLVDHHWHSGTVCFSATQSGTTQVLLHVVDTAAAVPECVMLVRSWYAGVDVVVTDPWHALPSVSEAIFVRGRA